MRGKRGIEKSGGLRMSLVGRSAVRSGPVVIAQCRATGRVVGKKVRRGGGRRDWAAYRKKCLSISSSSLQPLHPYFQSAPSDRPTHENK